jgi:hypothetical protein
LYASTPNGAQEETWRMVYTLPWESNQILSLYNGYSGFAPQPRVNAIPIVETAFATEAAQKQILENKIDAIVTTKPLTLEEREALQKNGWTSTFADEKTVLFRKM